jgi:DNA polymerase III subunit delta'
MAAAMSFLVGQDRVTRALTNAMKNDRLPHGLLFVGPNGVGRERAAKGLAAALVCEQKVVPFGCQTCRACRRAMSGSHPDVHLVLPEAEAVRRGIAEPDGKKKPSNDILVDAIRELAIRLRMAPYEGGARVAIVVDAQRMNANAQNALLKTLEEPAPKTWIVLIAPHERSVLPTLASRCLRLAFAPLSNDDVKTILTRNNVADADARVPLAEGSVARALAADPSASSGSLGAALLEALLYGTPVARLDAAEAAGKERSDVDAALLDLERRLSTKMRDAVFVDDPFWRRARNLLDDIREARDALRQNASVQLVLEDLLLTKAKAWSAAG